MAKPKQSPVLDWLLEPDDPSVRYLALRDLAHAHGKELQAAKKQAHVQGFITTVLSKMHNGGYWSKPGPGYLPKYKSTVWSLILLGQLGASADMDPRIACACDYILDHALNEHGPFTTNGVPSGTADCLQGNLCAALLELGCEDPRLDLAFDWMARTVTGDGIAPQSEKRNPRRYYAGKCGPNFACGSNNKLPCAWGATKVMLAFSKLPKQKRTPAIEEAINVGVQFLLGTDPAQANYPSGYAGKPSGNWWKFGFPVYYVTDLLQIVEALTALGFAKDARLANAHTLIQEKRDAAGRWSLEYEYTGKTWGNYGARKQPNKYVTLRALRVLQAAA